MYILFRYPVNFANYLRVNKDTGYRSTGSDSKIYTVGQSAVE